MADSDEDTADENEENDNYSALEIAETVKNLSTRFR